MGALLPSLPRSSPLLSSSSLKVAQQALFLINGGAYSSSLLCFLHTPRSNPSSPPFEVYTAVCCVVCRRSLFPVAEVKWSLADEEGQSWSQGAPSHSTQIQTQGVVRNRFVETCITRKRKHNRSLIIERDSSGSDQTWTSLPDPDQEEEEDLDQVLPPSLLH